MKKAIILSVTALSFMLGACNTSSTKNEQSNSTDSTAMQNGNTSQIFNVDTSNLKSGDIFYQCEMHPEVLSDKPGNCPKCGMDLMVMKKK